LNHPLEKSIFSFHENENKRSVNHRHQCACERVHERSTSQVN
jgi:hypothetical protein